MRICCLSDLHAKLPAPASLPDADLPLLGGDYIPGGPLDAQRSWLERVFAPWLEAVATRMPVIGVAGNHDELFEQAPDRVPAMAWTYLQDSGTTFQGLRVWNSPWQPRFCDWAFNATEDELRARWALIPPDTDILLLHGPPCGYGDFSPYGREHVGSPSLRDRIEAIRPRLAVYGHIHGGHGVYRLGPTILVNAAHCDEQYRPANSPITLDLA